MAVQDNRFSRIMCFLKHSPQLGVSEPWVVERLAVLALELPGKLDNALRQPCSIVFQLREHHFSECRLNHIWIITVNHSRPVCNLVKSSTTSKTNFVRN